MRRILLALASILTLGLVLSPLWGAFEVSRTFDEIEEQLDTVVPPAVEVTHEFRRGLWRSEAETRIAQPGGETLVVVRHRFVHGPLPIGELLEGRFPTGLAQAIVYSELDFPASSLPAKKRPRFGARTRIALGGFTEVALESETFEREDGSLRWGGLTGRIFGRSPSFEEMTGWIEAPSVWVQEARGEVAIETLTSDFDGRLGADARWLGRVHLGVGRIEISSPESRVTLGGLEWSQTSEDSAEEGYQLAHTLSVQTIDAEEGRYGPGRLRMVLRRIDPAVLREVQQSLADAGPGEDASARSQAAMDAFVKLASGSPEIEIEELFFAGPDGDLQSTARVGVDGDHPAIALGPLAAIAAVEANAEIDISARMLHHVLDAAAASQLGGGASPAALAVQAAALRSEWIRAAIEAGWLLHEGERYRLEVAYAAGGMRVNGRPLDPRAVWSLASPPSLGALASPSRRSAVGRGRAATALGPSSSPRARWRPPADIP